MHEDENWFVKPQIHELTLNNKANASGNGLRDLWHCSGLGTLDHMFGILHWQLVVLESGLAAANLTPNWRGFGPD